jgi:5-methylcytosine-specific restriction endonuclease McrA
MEDDIIRSRYYHKAMESFKTRLNLLLFERVIKTGRMGDISVDDFEKFQTTTELIKIYAAEYFQKDVNKGTVNGVNVNEIYNKMKEWKKKPESENFNLLRSHYWDHMFQKLFTYADFRDFFTKKEQKCHYCGITEEMVNLLRSKQEIFNKRDTRGFSMEIDRIEANKEYDSKNSVLCCYWCNNAKTDEFSYNEFVPIGESFRLLWNTRLEKHHLELIPDPKKQQQIE